MNIILSPQPRDRVHINSNNGNGIHHSRHNGCQQPRCHGYNHLRVHDWKLQQVRSIHNPVSGYGLKLRKLLHRSRFHVHSRKYDEQARGSWSEKQLEWSSCCGMTRKVPGTDELEPQQEHMKSQRRCRCFEGELKRRSYYKRQLEQSSSYVKRLVPNTDGKKLPLVCEMRPRRCSLCEESLKPSSYSEWRPRWSSCSRKFPAPYTDGTELPQVSRRILSAQGVPNIDDMKSMMRYVHLNALLGQHNGHHLPLEGRNTRRSCSRRLCYSHCRRSSEAANRCCPEDWPRPRQQMPPEQCKFQTDAC